MFANHQPLIGAYAQESSDNMARVLKFVVLSIRTRLFNLPADMAILENPQHPDELRGILYGSKAQAIAQIDAEADSIYAQAIAISHHARDKFDMEYGLLNLFSSIHGLGLAKSGFCAQLAFGVSACLDSHNVERFGLSPNMLKSSTFKNAKTAKTRARWIQRYCETVDKLGGTEFLWDSWCEYVFERPDETGRRMNGNESPYESVEHVSALHCLSLGINPE